MSLLSLDNIQLIIGDLNRELNYKISENKQEGMLTQEHNLLIVSSDGENHVIQFLGNILFSTALEKQLDNISPERELTLNERAYFEPHLRKLINATLNLYKGVIL